MCFHQRLCCSFQKEASTRHPLTKNIAYETMILFLHDLWISRVIPWESPFCPQDQEDTNPSRIVKGILSDLFSKQFLVRVEMLLSWETGQKQGKSEKWLGEGAEGVWGSLSRCPLRVFCTGATPESTGALWGCTSAKHSRRTSAQGPHTPFCTLS